MHTAREARSRATSPDSPDTGEHAKGERIGSTLSGTGPRTTFLAPVFTMPFAVGQVLAEKYVVDALIGVGGISFVVAAFHRGLESQVALKFLRPEFAHHPEASRRFVAEAKSNFKLHSEHIVRVLDVDRLADGVPFMVMERLAGVELRALIADRRVLPSELAVDLALQACEALATAHAARIVHQDIKPENLFVVSQSDRPHQLKLLDFGICREVITRDRRADRVMTSAAVGSPPYMSPEQVRGAADLDARSDIWSLGCVLYEMLSGRALFQRASQAEEFAAVLEAPYVPLPELVPTIAGELDQVVARCLAKLPSERFQTVAELADALVPFAPAHAYVHAARCAQLLDEIAERKSAVRLVVASRPTATQSIKA
ncbi:MAG TPA: serine/threonine-protein kinase, partial [Polyangiales bacterium]|nr:serine/threonine-protein kinase [Polyangiales bacterium]